jgi:hypothetical protein
MKAYKPFKMSTNVLNPTLYQRCVALFNKVTIRAPGETQVRKLTVDLVTSRKQPVIIQKGEYYAVCCPFCGDTRFRCNINHRYGTPDEFGRKQTHLAYCFNGGCPLSERDPAAYKKLEQMLCGSELIDLSKARLAQGSKPQKIVPMNWPGKVIRIDKLPADHEVNVYLQSRGFDHEVIGRFYNVHWCTESHQRICINRMIIPIYHEKKMVGWQARAAYDTDWKASHFPKYYTAKNTPKSSVLYNLANASKYKVGVIVEGVTDVWKLGPQAVCTLGASMTTAQQNLFIRHFKDYGGILLYDPDIRVKSERQQAEIETKLNQALKSGFCAVQLPDNTDPGSLAREYLREYIEKHAKINISWSKRCEE